MGHTQIRLGAAVSWGMFWVCLLACNCLAGSGLKLNVAPLEDEQVTSFKIMPDSSGVVYESGDCPNCDYRDVFLTPIRGGTTTHLNASLNRNRSLLFSYDVTPDGKYILLGVTSSPSSNFHEIYSVPTSGGQPVAILPSSIYKLRLDLISPESPYLIYTGYWASTVNLMRVPLTGGTPTVLSAPIGLDKSGGIDGSSAVLPLGGWQRLAYIEGRRYQVRPLVSIPINGGDVINLSPEGWQLENRFYATPDQQQVLFASSNRVYANDYNGGEPRLIYEADAGSTEPGRQYSYLESGFLLTLLSDTHAVFVTRESRTINSACALISAPLDGGEPVVIDQVDWSITTGAINSNYTQMLYYARSFSSNDSELKIAPMSGGTPISLAIDTPQYPSQSQRAQFAEYDGRTRVVYQAGGRIFSINSDGTDRVGLDESVYASGDETSTYHVTDDGYFVVFGMGSKTLSTTNRIYSGHVQGGTPVLITPDLPETAVISDFELTPDGTKIVYLADQDTPGTQELYVAGFPLAHLAAGIDVTGEVTGGVGFGGGLGFSFDQVDSPGTFRAEFFRTSLTDLEPGLASEIDFLLPGDTAQLWDMSYGGGFTGSVRLTFTYDESLLGPGVNESQLGIYHRLSDGLFEQLTVLDRDFDNNTVTVATDSFSNFVLGVVPEPGSVVLLSGLCLILTSRRSVL